MTPFDSARQIGISTLSKDVRPSAVSINVPNLGSDTEAQRNVFQHLLKFVPQALSIIPGWKTATNFPPGIIAVIKMASVVSSLITDSSGVDDALAGVSLLSIQRGARCW